MSSPKPHRSVPVFIVGFVLGVGVTLAVKCPPTPAPAAQPAPAPAKPIAEKPADAAPAKAAEPAPAPVVAPVVPGKAEPEPVK